MSSLAVPLPAHLLSLAGGALLLGSVLVYLGVVALAVARVHRQYGSAMPGRQGMRAGAALTAGVRYSPLLLGAAAGAVILAMGR